jgi:hypothetical protein
MSMLHHALSADNDQQSDGATAAVHTTRSFVASDNSPAIMKHHMNLTLLTFTYISYAAT